MKKTDLIFKYYIVDFTTQGKFFPCVVKFMPGNRHWTCIYINKENRNDWFIRNEVISPELLSHGTEVTEQVFEMKLNLILQKLSYGETISSF